jgi:hypothetical protein
MENMVDQLQSNEDDNLSSGIGNNDTGKPVIGNTPSPLHCCESHKQCDDKAVITTKINEAISDESVGKWEDKHMTRMANDDVAYILERGHIIYDGDKRVSRMLDAIRDNIKKELLRKN